ncbi:hypothetical protein D9619_008932 [Psilocybe cf. subviscida]|uniref:Histone-lysine N-methyltransferase SET5 n=1 Tax=Psilocybe cf. subviscida TaxID=2480587 RepID=A0A8H5FA19_9AGAR|nr:hypothetical protein D9619_008932 [Psilocybe cf. subviscida]
MSTPTITPTEEELKLALINLKTLNPGTGISKIHALLLKTYPEWLVSEKRTKKIMQFYGLVSQSMPPLNEANIPAEPPMFPQSRVIDSLDVYQWTSKVAVKYFDKKKGKGLITVTDIEEGETIWREDPFIIAAEWEILDLQQKSAACGYCTTPLVQDSPLVHNCPSSSTATYCPFRFCNRLCLARSAKTHPLLCPAQNPPSAALVKMAYDTQWMALHAYAQCTARILLSNQHSDAALQQDMDIFRGLAALGLEERYKYSFKVLNYPEPNRGTWKKAFDLYTQAFRSPKHPPDQKRLAKLLKRPLPLDVQHDLLEYETGFLRGLGRMSLNLESHGGIYTLHAHLNHSCDPNVSVRHVDQRTALSRISLIAKRPIKAGEELLVTYVNPKLGFKARQEELRGWGFGACTCKRCVDEAKMVAQEPISPSGEAATASSTINDLEGLAEELKAGLGVL